MSYSKEIYGKATDIINNRRLKAQREAEFRREKIFAEHPDIEKLNREISSCGIMAAKAVLMGSDVKTELNNLKEKSLSLQEKLKKRLVESGCTANALEPHYLCTVCEDTGYYEENNKTLVCDCLKKALIKCSCDALNESSPLKLCTFDDFSLNHYSNDAQPGETSDYRKMSRILEFCKNYAENFSNNSKSILMRGATGLGKTHLSLAIANEVIQMGYSAVYVSAPVILSKLEKEHFSNNYNAEEETLSALMDCDLLIIDDLGTEFMNNFSVSEIYNIFNSRLLRSKPVIINTNLTLKEIESAYTQRFLSRIAGCAVRLDFVGSDVRISGEKKRNF